MATYAIGDIQGCIQELQDLLDKINFDETNDHLWFTGDLVNRGPQSLESLRFVTELGNNVITVLGNHDLHLLAVAQDISRKRPKDTLDDILQAPDRDNLIDWLRQQPLIHQDDKYRFTMVHAGFIPQWDLAQAIELAQEVESILKGDNYTVLLNNMYGNTPQNWTDDLTGPDRLRFIINCLTRIRYCDADGRLAIKETGPPGSQPAGYEPWFTNPARLTKKEKIIFGHWSTIYIGDISDFTPYNVYPLDTGCVWGSKLSALRLEDENWFSVPSRRPKKFK